jgi:adenylate kinase family enzyme
MTRVFRPGVSQAMPLPPLTDLGSRIMICGTSNTGKSTLALAISDKLGLPVVHLDRLRFRPGTDWQQRPDEEFRALHDEAVLPDRWIFEGNYTSLMPKRIERATGIILLRDNRWANFGRYLWRTVMQKDRAGNLEGNRDSLKWDMVTWVLLRAPRNVARYSTMLPATGLPYVEIASMRRLREVYRAWDLALPRH